MLSKLELLAKKLSLPRSVLTGQFGSDLRLIEQAKLIAEEVKPQPFVPFEDNNIETAYFKTTLEAKLAIAKLLGKPLAVIPEVQRLEAERGFYSGNNLIGMGNGIETLRRLGWALN